MVPERLFAIVVIDEANLFEPIKVVMSGGSTETWSTDTCKEVASVLDGHRPKIASEDVLSCYAQHLEAGEKRFGAPRVLVVGSYSDDRFCDSSTDDGSVGSFIPPVGAEVLGNALKVAIGEASPLKCEEADPVAA